LFALQQRPLLDTHMNFGRRIKAERVARGLSQKQVGIDAGIPEDSAQATVQAIEDRDSQRTKYATGLARALGLQLEWALQGRGDKYLKDDAASRRSGASTERVVIGPSADKEFLLIDEVNVEFRGGPGHAIEYEVIENGESAAYRISWFNKERINPERVIRCKATGDSNEPFLYAGDIILVNKDETEIRNGKVYAFWQDDEGRRIKKLFVDKKKGTLTIRSFNPDFPDEEMSIKEAAAKIIVIGRVRDRGGRGGL
jgi:phage repressor protein C with HTH and peptisase S24 domain